MINTLHLLILLALNTSNTTTVSWYGERFNGRQTSSGEVYNMNNYTCASATLPFGTRVLITNPSNNKSVIVRVNDRGPFAMNQAGEPIKPLRPHPKRLFDLSKAAFKSISNTSSGAIAVNFVVIK